LKSPFKAILKISAKKREKRHIKAFGFLVEPDFVKTRTEIMPIL
jgi:hypothetical protein